MKDKFIQFLKDNGALNKFIANLENQSGNTIENHMYYNAITSWVSAAFPWDGEDFDLWSELDEKWTKLITK